MKYKGWEISKIRMDGSYKYQAVNGNRTFICKTRKEAIDFIEEEELREQGYN